jgi:hypothetical protein
MNKLVSTGSVEFNLGFTPQAIAGKLVLELERLEVDLKTIGRHQE